MSTLIIIPARMESKRFPGKPLAMAGGRPLIHWTYERAKQTNADNVIVATPDREIARYCDERGIIWRPTAVEHPNGASRCAEVLYHLRPGKEFDTVIDWQCDEPLVSVDNMNLLMKQDCSKKICTLVAPFGSDDVIYNRNIAKAVVLEGGRCQWFSRSYMNGSFHHIGIYSFSPLVLKVAGALQPTPLSHAEQLEQLTWIEKGFDILAVTIDQAPLSINTPEDFEV